MGGSYTFQIYKQEATHTVMLWNGVKDYERIPSPENIRSADTGGLAFGRKVVIAQIGQFSPNILPNLNSMLALGDSVIMWARDTRTYEAIRDELRLMATRKFDGSPIAKQ
jgi:hypothetical protein